MEDFKTEFEDLTSMVLTIEPSLPESYFISTFIGGLQYELQNAVRVLKPVSLEEVMVYARMQEGSFDRLILKTKSHNNSTISPITPPIPETRGNIPDQSLLKLNQYSHP